MYALYAISNNLSPSRLDDNINNIVKERYAEQLVKMSARSAPQSSSTGDGGAEGKKDVENAFESEAIPAFEELFLYACPKFIAANPPPYDDPSALATIIQSPDSPSSLDPAHRHLSLFLSDVRAHAPIPTLRSFLKLYTSLDARKLAGFLEEGEEEMVQRLMAMKVGFMMSVSRVEGSNKGDNDGEVKKGGLLEGNVVSTGDLNFVINEVRPE